MDIPCEGQLCCTDILLCIGHKLWWLDIMLCAGGINSEGKNSCASDSDILLLYPGTDAEHCILIQNKTEA